MEKTEAQKGYGMHRRPHTGRCQAGLQPRFSESHAFPMTSKATQLFLGPQGRRQVSLLFSRRCSLNLYLFGEKLLPRAGFLQNQGQVSSSMDILISQMRLQLSFVLQKYVLIVVEDSNNIEYEVKYVSFSVSLQSYILN